MTNGDDINNLLRTLGHDAGIYQDLAQYNASRAAVRRAAMVRPAEAAAPALQTPTPTAVTATPPVLRVVQGSPAGSSSLTSILSRLASPTAPAPADGRESGAMTRAPLATGHSSVQPARLDQLFGRLATRNPGSTDR
ncbi:BcsR/BcsP family cellulose biosynthesis protein [uncultured Sphaerotilus sp.]|uniref:BcsR/BcsP family cellulose biosynthesis protein n=1 Tax=uncultured Sphaerotilus sp. TaxID=474984 RepID=UPI0030CA252B